MLADPQNADILGQFNVFRHEILYSRKCLRCDRKFITNNKFNRLCNHCNISIKSHNILSEEQAFGCSFCVENIWR